MNNRILNFREFMIKESESFNYEIDEIKNIIEDGYEIFAENFSGNESIPPVGKLLITSQDDNNVTISFCDRFGKMDKKINLPKDSIKINKIQENQYSIKIDPNQRWLNKRSNREILEDFIEDYINSKIDNETYKTRQSDTVKDDVYFIMEILGVPCEVKDLKKCEDGKYEISLTNDMQVDIRKKSPDQFIGNFEIFRKKSDVYPSVSINSERGKTILNFNIDDFEEEEIESDIQDINKNDYLNYLLKKSLGIENSEDEERLYNHFLEVENREDWKYNDLDEKEKQERSKKDEKYVKKLKKLLRFFISDKKIREVSKNKD